MRKKFYITTAIDYVNSSPHLGHAFEKILADVLARYHRMEKENVFFLTGTDEHGVKNAKSAEAQGMPVKEFVDKNAEKFKQLAEALDISNDFFIRTTDKETHWPAVEKMWKNLEIKGDVYKKKYKGLYCVGHEAFITKKDLTDGKCALHKKEPQNVEEENYFFRLSKYTEKIKKAVVSNEFKIVPDSSRNELLQLVEEGLEDVSFSRPSKDLKWGIPVPGDPSQTIYVWCDALVNYLSAVGYGNSKFKAYWPPDIQVIGKDILRFHGAIWPGMLISADLPLPKTLFVHGFISIGGEKMSKSLGNVVDPLELTEKYGRDAVRYYLLREIPSTRDGDFTREKFEERYVADLSRGLGNFTSRVVVLGASHLKGSFESKASKETERVMHSVIRKYHKKIRDFRFDEALQTIWELVSYGDKFVDSKKLWELPDKDYDKFREYIAELCMVLGSIALMLNPFLPGTAEKIFEQLGVSHYALNERAVFILKKGKALFPKLD